MLKKLLGVLGLLLSTCLPVSAQNGVRYDNYAFASVTGGNGILAIPNAIVTVCTSAGTGNPCAPTAPIYSDAALSLPITLSQVTSDAGGNFGFYVAPGRYTYSVRSPSGLTGFFAFTASPTLDSANTWLFANSFSALITANAGITSVGPNTLNGGGVFSGTYSGNPTLTGTVTFSGPANLNGGGALNGSFSGPTTLTGVANLNGGGSLNGSFSGPTTLTGNVTGIVGQNTFNAYKFNNFLYVDGIKYTTLAAAFADLPANGGTVFDCFPETWSADPFVAMAKPFKLIFCNNIAVQWITNVPLAIRHSGQIISGGGPNGTQITASGTFPINSYILSLGLPYPGIYGSRLEDIAISCGLAPVVGCGAVNFDGVQELSGALRIQGVNCTTTLGCIRISSDQGAGATQDTLTFQGIGGIMFTGTNQSCVGPVIEIAASTVSKVNVQDVTAIGVVGGCGGPVTPAGVEMDSVFEANLSAIHGEQATSVILSTSTANVQITQVTGHTSTPNVFTSTAAGGNWNVNDLFASGCTNNTLNDTGDSLFSACPANVTFEARSGVSSPSTFGSVPTIGWVQTVPNGSGVGFTQRLLAGFTPSSKAIGLFDTNGTDLNYAILNDGRFQWRGGQAAAFSQVDTSDLLTANRVRQAPNGPSSTVMVAALVTTAATTDNVTIQGMTSSGHCSLTATNAAAAAATLPSVTTKAANQITVTHAVTANMNYDVMCTSN